MKQVLVASRALADMSCRAGWSGIQGRVHVWNDGLNGWTGHWVDIFYTLSHFEISISKLNVVEVECSHFFAMMGYSLGGSPSVCSPSTFVSTTVLFGYCLNLHTLASAGQQSRRANFPRRVLISGNQFSRWIFQNCGLRMM